MMSLLVLVVLLGMWGFVLFPLVRSRNAKVDEIRSVARFSSALRVLSGGRADGRHGMRQFVMPPRAGLAAVRAARQAAAARPRAGVRLSTAPAARRRRNVLIGTGGFFVFSVLLLAVMGSSAVVIQLLADVSLIGGVALCRWSAQQERAAARRAARRTRMPAARRVDHIDLTETEPGVLPVMTVPLDAPALPRRAVPTHKADVPPAAVAASRAAVSPAAVARPVADRTPAARPRPVTRPRAEPVVLAEIDLDWDPVISEPASMVRVLGVSPARPRVRIFDDADDDMDLGDDAGLDVLVSRRAAASGW